MYFISSRSQRYQRTIQTTHLVRCYLRIVHLFYQQSWAISVPYMKFWFLKYPPPRTALIGSPGNHTFPCSTPPLGYPRAPASPGVHAHLPRRSDYLGVLYRYSFIYRIEIKSLKLWGGNLTFQKMFSFFWCFLPKVLIKINHTMMIWLPDCHQEVIDWRIRWGFVSNQFPLYATLQSLKAIQINLNRLNFQRRLWIRCMQKPLWDVRFFHTKLNHFDFWKVLKQQLCDL